MSSDEENRFAALTALIADPAAPLNPEYVAHEALACADAVPAAARLASVAVGAGFGVEQNWHASLRWLGSAAARGDADARQQLELLTPGAHGDWEARAADADIASLTAARVVAEVHAQPRIGVAESFLEPEFCAWMIARARSVLAPSLVYNPTRAGGRRDDTRTNSAAEFSIANLDVPMLIVRARIANTMSLHASQLERFSVFHYATGQHFGPHYDYLDPKQPQFAADIARRGQRIATFLVYLNDAFEAGETHFIEVDRKWRPPAGGALFFYNVDQSGAPERLSLHEGVSPTLGEKWLLSQFIRDQPQLAG